MINPRTHMTSWRTRAAAVLGVTVASAVLAACGGGGSSGVAVRASTGAGAPSTTAFSLTTGGVPHLVSSTGRTIYEFSADTTGHSNCTGACAAVWLPVTSTTSPAARGNVSADRLTTGPNHQVMYAGHPLYYFAGDQAAGDAKGQGINNFGGLWSEVAADGSPIDSGATSSSSSPYSGGYGNG